MKILIAVVAGAVWGGGAVFLWLREEDRGVGRSFRWPGRPDWFDCAFFTLWPVLVSIAFAWDWWDAVQARRAVKRSEAEKQ
jgi:hypothetical protein